MSSFSFVLYLSLNWTRQHWQLQRGAKTICVQWFSLLNSNLSNLKKQFKRCSCFSCHCTPQSFVCYQLNLVFNWWMSNSWKQFTWACCLAMTPPKKTVTNKIQFPTDECQILGTNSPGPIAWPYLMFTCDCCLATTPPKKCHQLMNVKFLELIHLGLLPGHTWCSTVTVA